MGKLIVHRHDGSARAYSLDRDRITIGRRADNDICLAYPPVSAEHAIVITIGGDSFLEDLGSTNGTLVNGERIARHFLRDRDEIDVGRIAITYLANDDEEQAVETPAAKTPVVDAPEAAATVDAGVPDDGSVPISEADEAADEIAAPADELLADLMESHSTAAAALDLSPNLTVVRNDWVNGNGSGNDNGSGNGSGNGNVNESGNGNSVNAGLPIEARITILSGPHSGEAMPMNKAQFVFGKPGVSVAAIRRSGGVYRLVPLTGDKLPVVNGGAVDRAGAELAFGDTIEVAGVRLRFERRM